MIDSRQYTTRPLAFVWRVFRIPIALCAGVLLGHYTLSNNPYAFSFIHGILIASSILFVVSMFTAFWKVAVSSNGIRIKPVLRQGYSMQWGVMTDARQVQKGKCRVFRDDHGMQISIPEQRLPRKDEKALNALIREQLSLHGVH